MKVEVKALPKSEVKLTIELTEEEMKKYEQKATRQISEMVKIPGFRPGKAPLEMLEKQVSHETIDAHMIDIAVPEIYGEVVKKEKIEVVSRPKINVISTHPLQLEATVAVYPQVAVAGYEKMDIPAKEVKVTAHDVDHVLEDIQKKHAKYEEVDREAKMGDRVEVDFEGFDEAGAPLENTKSANHPVILGEKTLVEGFEEALVGMKKDEKKTFQVTFPKDYFHKKFQDKKVEFRVEVKKVEEIKMPELDAEFLSRISGGNKTLDEVKKIIEENLARDAEYQEKVRRENEALEKIIKLTKVEIPEILVEEELDGMMDELKNELESRGISFDMYMQQTKKEIKDLRDERLKEAMNRLILRFALQQIFKQDGIAVGEDELNHEIEHVVSLYPAAEQYKLRKEYKEGSYLLRRLENKIKMDKLFERILGK
jgi:trigger factor